MSGFKGALVTASLTLVCAGAASAQEAQPEGTPPPWNVLVRCAETADADARVACYDAAMRAAGYAPKPEAVAAEKRRRFGLSMPQIGLLKKKSKSEGAAAAAGAAGAQAAAAPQAAPEDNPDEVTVVIEQVATVQPFGRLVIFTTDAQIWEQTDQEQVQPPRAGQSMKIHREVFGGYFCDVTKYKTVRCKRDR